MTTRRYRSSGRDGRRGSVFDIGWSPVWVGLHDQTANKVDRAHSQISFSVTYGRSTFGGPTMQYITYREVELARARSRSCGAWAHRATDVSRRFTRRRVSCCQGFSRLGAYSRAYSSTGALASSFDPRRVHLHQLALGFPGRSADPIYPAAGRFPQSEGAAEPHFGAACLLTGGWRTPPCAKCFLCGPQAALISCA